MNSLRNKRQLTANEWTHEIDSFQKLKSLFLDQGGPVRHYPIPLGQEGGGKYILHIDWSKWGMAGVLYQHQHEPDKPVFIGAVGQKCTKYKVNYYSNKGELAVLYFALEKYKYLLLHGPSLPSTY